VESSRCTVEGSKKICEQEVGNAAVDLEAKGQLDLVDYEVDPYEDALCNVAPPKGSDDAFFQNDCKCASSNVSMDKVRFITPSSISSFIDCVSCRFENVQYCVSKFYSLYVAFH
jgi:hypothetical protein